MNIDKEKILIYYDEGQLYQEFYETNRKLNGVRIWYYKSGKIKQTGNYINGNCDGEFISYYQSGKIRSITHYQKGKILGIKNFNINIVDKSKIGIQSINQKIMDTSKQISTKTCIEASRIKKEKLNHENLKKILNKTTEFITNILNNIIEFITKNKKLIKIVAIVMIVILCSFHFNVYDKIRNLKNTVAISFRNEKDNKKESFCNNLINFRDEKVAYIKEKIGLDKNYFQKIKNLKKIITKKTKKTKKIDNEEPNKILREEIKTKPQITTQMKKDNFIKLSQILKDPKYKTYILNIGAGYKISLPDGIFTNITQNVKNKNLKFSSKYNEININFIIISLQNIKFKTLYKKEINNLNGKMTILNSDLSRNKYYINGVRNKKTGMYRYAYYNRKKKEVAVIEFNYPISLDKYMKKIIKTTSNKFEKK